MLINNKTIIKDNDSLIREKSNDVPLPLSKEDEELLMSMWEYVDKSTNAEIAQAEDLRPAVGISAIQVGIPKKMTAVILKNAQGDKIHSYALVNPKIVSQSVELAYLGSGEGCLSVPSDHEGYVYRPARIKVKGYDLLTKQNVEIRATNYFAIVLQHELDHFKGTLYYDHINKVNPFVEDPNAICIE